MALRRRSFVIKRMPGFTLLALACFFALYMPLAPLVVYSFNEGNNIALWEGFSLRWYQAAWENQLVQSAAIRSIVIATIASIVATVLAACAGVVAKDAGLCMMARWNSLLAKREHIRK